ncbi:hypothetical protein PSTT_04349 [Puccinia striiformis]|uniref:Uncharacterized protein n=1 Tax=Puccinia striiformis TaxID=27350 RepID=A0A2S4VTD4_9BASI|nr:hypothetical protein PSTT_04349 [Puccinia striiformis]
MNSGTCVGSALLASFILTCTCEELRKLSDVASSSTSYLSASSLQTLEIAGETGDSPCRCTLNRWAVLYFGPHDRPPRPHDKFKTHDMVAHTMRSDTRSSTHSKTWVPKVASIWFLPASAEDGVTYTAPQSSIRPLAVAHMTGLPSLYNSIGPSEFRGSGQSASGVCPLLVFNHRSAWLFLLSLRDAAACEGECVANLTKAYIADYSQKANPVFDGISYHIQTSLPNLPAGQADALIEPIRQKVSDAIHDELKKGLQLISSQKLNSSASLNLTSDKLASSVLQVVSLGLNETLSTVSKALATLDSLDKKPSGLSPPAPPAKAPVSHITLLISFWLYFPTFANIHIPALQQPKIPLNPLPPAKVPRPEVPSNPAPPTKAPEPEVPLNPPKTAGSPGRPFAVSTIPIQAPGAPKLSSRNSVSRDTSAPYKLNPREVGKPTTLSSHPTSADFQPASADAQPVRGAPSQEPCAIKLIEKIICLRNLPYISGFLKRRSVASVKFKSPMPTLLSSHNGQTFSSIHKRRIIHREPNSKGSRIYILADIEVKSPSDGLIRENSRSLLPDSISASDPNSEETSLSDIQTSFREHGSANEDEGLKLVQFILQDALMAFAARLRNDHDSMWEKLMREHAEPMN